MQKGISRQIVEVTRTDNPYFERAFLVVRTDCTDHPPERLDQEAARFLQQQTPYTGIKKARRFHLLQKLSLLLLGGGVGALLAALFHTFM